MCAHTRYKLKLPKINDGNCRIGAKSGIPMSTTARNLEDSFKNITTLSNVSMTTHLGNNIIAIFTQLYDKYISNSSEYCINIRSQTRKLLKSMFDEKFYQVLQYKLQSTLPPRLESASPSVSALESSPNVSNHKEVALWDRIKYQSGTRKLSLGINNIESTTSNSTSTIDSSTNVDCNGIAAKFAEKGENGNDGNDLIEWLLNELIQSTEQAIVEISLLMNDSFVRFRKNDAVYKKVVELACAQLEA